MSRANFKDPWKVRADPDSDRWEVYYQPDDYSLPFLFTTYRGASEAAAALNKDVDQQQVDIDRAYG